MNGVRSGNLKMPKKSHDQRQKMAPFPYSIWTGNQSLQYSSASWCYLQQKPHTSITLNSPFHQVFAQLELWYKHPGADRNLY